MRDSLGAGGEHIVHSDSRLNRLNHELWQAYARAISQGAQAPLGFVIRARTEDSATLLMDRFRSQGCQIVWLKRKWWPSRYRWELAAKTKEPLALTQEAIEQWTQTLQGEIQPYDAILTHWVPAGA